jgi:hypothetical protein
MSKLDALAELVRLRRNDTCPNMISLHDFEDGRWDLDHVVPLVVPWTKSACNVDAKLMIIGQDWASEKYFQRPKNRTSWRDTLRTHLGQDPQLPTNRNIRRLLRCFGIKWRQTYATDVSIFVKPGNMNGDVPDALLRYCAIKYTIPQLRIVRPKMVLCLGSRTFNAVRYALGMPSMKLSAACGVGRTRSMTKPGQRFTEFRIRVGLASQLVAGCPTFCRSGRLLQIDCMDAEECLF